jgi:hypothetical protein
VGINEYSKILDKNCSRFFGGQRKCKLKLLLVRYGKFMSECYDDGYNRRYQNIVEGTSVQLPTSNEEGERHQELNSDWKEHVFLGNGR